MCRGLETLEHSIINRMSPSILSPQDSGSFVEDGVERVLELERMEKKEQGLLNTAGLMHMCTYRDGSREQRVYTGLGLMEL